MDRIKAYTAVQACIFLFSSFALIALFCVCLFSLYLRGTLGIGLSVTVFNWIGRVATKEASETTSDSDWIGPYYLPTRESLTCFSATSGRGHTAPGTEVT